MDDLERIARTLLDLDGAEAKVQAEVSCRERRLAEIAVKQRLLDELLPDLRQADASIEGEWGSSDDLANRLVEILLAPYPRCGAVTVFWPDVEACDAVCVWPRQHGGTRHMDETLGSWDEDELVTSYPGE